MTAKAQPNEYGVTWAVSRNVELQIAVRPPRYAGAQWSVDALYTGTHDLAPVTRFFHTEPEARTYANQLWSRR